MFEFFKSTSDIIIEPNCQLVIKSNLEPRIPTSGAEKRHFEYLLSRNCLEIGCQNLGFPFHFDQSGQDKKIVLPDTYLGSVSHSHQAAAALLAPKAKYQAVGVDIESANRTISSKFKQRVFTPLELELINQHVDHQDRVATLIFSAKESIYKACHQKIDKFSYQNIQITDIREEISARLVNQLTSFPKLEIRYGCYKQTHLVTCLIIPKY